MRTAFTGQIPHMTAAELEGLAEELELDVVGAARFRPTQSRDEPHDTIIDEIMGELPKRLGLRAEKPS